MEEIVHKESENKFCINVLGQECFLKYSVLADKLWEISETYVPVRAYKEEVEDSLINYVMQYIKRNNIQVLISCSCVQDFMVRNKHLKEVIYHPY